jgi:hypothetical protein
VHSQGNVSARQAKNVVLYIAYTTATLYESRMHDVTEFEELITSFAQLFDSRSAVINIMNVDLPNQQRLVT